MATISDKPWGSISQADYADAGTYCDASLINENSGPRSSWSKSACKLPVREPDGTLNRNGVHAAAARLSGAGGGVDAPPALKRTAARVLLRMYGQMNETPPESITRMAQG